MKAEIGPVSPELRTKASAALVLAEGSKPMAADMLTTPKSLWTSFKAC